MTTNYDLSGKRIWIAGHTGMVGSALIRRLANEPCSVVTVARPELDLTRQDATERWMREARPDAIILAAAKVGGIVANTRQPAEFLYDNLMIGANIMRAAYETGVERLIYLGSSCVYPREAGQPIAEDALLSGPLERTNEGYAVAKIACLKLAEAYAREYGRAFFSAMPTNLYGPNDNFDPLTSHVLPGLIRKIHDAKMTRQAKVTLWGSGRPLREFLHVDDLADALVLMLRRYDGDGPLNIGSGDEISIREAAELVADIVGFEGTFVFDPERPDGTPRKLLDSSCIRALGWQPRIGLRNGLEELYHRFQQRPEAFYALRKSA
ncbi:MAG TPA: GDP-L-fucose synthase [Pararhizobium sp.]|nr:GDP-L-fucose synthase [Pararhizobium sp.]